MGPNEQHCFIADSTAPIQRICSIRSKDRCQLWCTEPRLDDTAAAPLLHDRREDDGFGGFLTFSMMSFVIC
jgi:hypothetical protein